MSAPRDVYALLLAMVGELDDNGDDLVVCVERTPADATGRADVEHAWTASVRDGASMAVVAAATATGESGEAALAALVVTVEAALRARMGTAIVLLDDVRRWREAVRP